MDDYNDLAGKSFWNDTWKHTKRIKNINLQYRHHRALHDVFVEAFAERSGLRVLEVGAGNSVWLPYIAKKFGQCVAGLDYSELGCLQALRNLQFNQVEGEIYHRNLFDENDDLTGQYDIVFSLGVVEHFDDPGKPLQKMRGFCKSGGSMITVIPNLIGTYGTLQRILKRDIYDIHVPMSPERLALFHREADLKVKSSQYTGFFSLTILNFSHLPSNWLRASYWLMMQINKLVWSTSAALGYQPETRSFSPYIVVVATNE